MPSASRSRASPLRFRAAHERAPVVAWVDPHLRVAFAGGNPSSREAMGFAKDSTHPSGASIRTRSSSADGGDITRDGGLQDPFGAGRYDAIEIVAVDRVELKRFQCRRDGLDLLRAERNEVRIAVHEAQEFSVRRYRRDIRRAQHPAAAGSRRPMQDGSAGEMTAAADQRDIGQERQWLALPK